MQITDMLKFFNPDIFFLLVVLGSDRVKILLRFLNVEKLFLTTVQQKRTK